MLYNKLSSDTMTKNNKKKNALSFVFLRADDVHLDGFSLRYLMTGVTMQLEVKQSEAFFPGQSHGGRLASQLRAGGWKTYTCCVHVPFWY